MLTVKTKYPEIIPFDPGVQINTGELIVYHGSRLIQEVKQIVKEGGISRSEAVRIGLQILTGILGIVIRGKKHE